MGECSGDGELPSASGNLFFTLLVVSREMLAGASNNSSMKVRITVVTTFHFRAFLKAVLMAQLLSSSSPSLSWLKLVVTFFEKAGGLTLDIFCG